jgi:uncharacterized protein (TIGR03083 family)
MTMQDDLESERRAIAETFTRVGETARTLCAPWTAFDLAAHLVSLERQAGVATFIGRSLVARGVRLNDRAGGFADRVIRRERRHGFDELVDWLRRPSPWLLLRSRLLAVGLFEMWTHHEDLAQPNGIAHSERAGLDDVVTWLVRYQSAAKDVRVAFRIVSTRGREWCFGDATVSRVTVEGTTGDLVRWLSGRPTLGALQFSGSEDAVAEVRALRPHV